MRAVILGAGMAERATNGPVIAPDDPEAADVQVLIRTHLAAMQAASPPESMHALDIANLKAPGISFYTVRDGGVLAGMGAIRALDATSGELKSMHTPQAMRGHGHGARLLAYLIQQARARGYARLYLETGPGPDHAASRRLYSRHGFAQCGRFGDYPEDPNSAFMVLMLG